MMQSLGTPYTEIQLLKDRVLEEIHYGFWHTTPEDRFNEIMKQGEISPTPDVPNKTRDQEKFSYVRSLGGVSLFDLRDFDPVSYSTRFRSSSWFSFIPILQNYDSAIWIEILENRLPNPIVSGSALLDMWRSSGNVRRIMPDIEAAYIGSIPSKSFGRIFRVKKGSDQLEFL